MAAGGVERRAPVASAAIDAQIDSGIESGIDWGPARDDVRTWLQMVKTVLPMERELNRIFQQDFGQFGFILNDENALTGRLHVSQPQSAFELDEGVRSGKLMRSSRPPSLEWTAVILPP